MGSFIEGFPFHKKYYLNATIALNFLLTILLKGVYIAIDERARCPCREYFNYAGSTQPHLWYTFYIKTTFGHTAISHFWLMLLGGIMFIFHVKQGLHLVLATFTYEYSWPQTETDTAA